MQDHYQQLLDATIQHLQDLKARGIKYISIPRESLVALDQRPPARKLATPAHSVAAPAFTPPPFPSPRPTPAPAPVERKTLFETATPPPAAALGPEAKAAAMADLRARALACQKCPHLARSRRNVVFGVGDSNAMLMFVGEAPGADEDEQGEPFVGRAGQLLTRIIQAMGFTRQTVYIANILKCRPDTPGQTAGNRKPTPEEVHNCLPFLQAQIDLIQPKVMVALGATAMEGLFGKSSVGITRLRGHFQVFQGIPLMPTYHPSYLLRNQAWTVKREVWEDMLQVMEKLGVPISEKQRNYFK
ncbi:MAG: uracil-DNA glycosylase [Chloroflexi bacterium]|nr:uracil-DNA glycosylase [Chloroflexota bacterium]